MAAITLPADIAMYTGTSFAAVVATADITNPIACVKFTGPGQIIVTAGAAESACGFIYEPGASASNPIKVGDRVTVFSSGYVWAMASAAIATVGTFVGTAAAGKVVTYTAANPYCGITTGIAAGDTEWVPILICFGTAA